MKRHIIALDEGLTSSLDTSTDDAEEGAYQRSIERSEQQKLIGGKLQIARTRTLGTPAGILVLRNFCPPSLVEELRAHSGLRAFARLPEREHELLLGLARRSDSALTIAYTPSGEIVGQVTLAPADTWWGDLKPVYEIAVEVSTPWRKLGVARHLLTLALELDGLEEMIILAMGLSWHWDMQGMGLTPFRYRQLIAQLFAAYNFSEYQTAEPNIVMDPANIFLARIGSHVDLFTLNAFLTRLLSFDNLAGLE